MTWIYRNQLIDQIPQGYIGFVYLITNLANQRLYVGKKLFYFTKTSSKTVQLKNGTKKKKRIKTQIPSDWMEYWGSSDLLQQDIDLYGKTMFRREILYLCENKSQMSYLEAREQMDRRVLESPIYYNNGIQLRIHGNHILGKL